MEACKDSGKALATTGTMGADYRGSDAPATLADAVPRLTAPTPTLQNRVAAPYPKLVDPDLGDGAFPALPEGVALSLYPELDELSDLGANTFPALPNDAMAHPRTVGADIFSGEFPGLPNEAMAYPKFVVGADIFSGALPAPPIEAMAYPKFVVGADIFSGEFPALPYNAMAHPEFVVGADIFSGAFPALPYDAMAYPKFVGADVVSGAFTAQLNGAMAYTYPKWNTSNLGSRVPPAIASYGGLGTFIPAPDTGADSYVIDVPDGAAGLGFQKQLGQAATDEEHGGYYYNYNSGPAIPIAAAGSEDADGGGAVGSDGIAAGAFAERRGGGIGGLGLAAASLAVAGLAAGGAATPAVAAFGLVATLIAGVTLITARMTTRA